MTPITPSQLAELRFALSRSIYKLEHTESPRAENKEEWEAYKTAILKRRRETLSLLDKVDGFFGYTDKDEFAAWVCFETGAYYIETEDTLDDPYDLPMAFGECCSGDTTRIRVPCRKEEDVPKMLALMYPDVKEWHTRLDWNSVGNDASHDGYKGKGNDNNDNDNDNNNSSKDKNAD